jgi:hypothetical protein
MKIEDVKVGMHLRDPKGNVWEILDKSVDTDIPYIHVKCTEFVQPVGVMPTYIVDTQAKAYVGCMLLINKKHLVVAPESVIEQFKDYFATGHQCIHVVTGLNKSKTLRFVTQEQYDNVEVTLESLEPIPEAVRYTVADLSIGMVFEDANGNRYFVSGWMQDKVLLYTILHPSGVSGEVLKLHASFWVDLEASQDTVSLKDFRKVED